MKLYKANKKLLEENHSYDPSFEHDACGVGLITSLDAKKKREVVEYGIQSLKAVWHRGAVDAEANLVMVRVFVLKYQKNFFWKK